MSAKPTNIPKCHLRQSADSARNISRHRKLGELTENIRTFALPFESKTYSFKMQYEYDSWNRIQSITYPDGEVVRYGYNKGGMLKSVSSSKNGVAHRYIDSIRYNKFELKEEVYYGNGTGVHYIYDLQQRLSHLRSWMHGGNTMQKIGYTYDSASNITGIVNVATMLPNGLGGIYSSIYTYDNLYRLTGSSGIWAGSDTLDYRTETEYHTNGRIRRKQVEAETLSNGNVSQISYNNGYYYDNLQQPNTLSRITATEEMVPGISIRNGNDRSSSFLVRFSWDATGNMVSQDPAGDAGRRFLCWDEQNRLQGVLDDRALSVYQYDANGDRTYKLTGDYIRQNVSGTWRYFYQLNKATLYASPYLVVTPQGYTKHYYAENERIASKLGNGGLNDLDHPILEVNQVYSKLRNNTEHAQKVMYQCLHTQEARTSSPLTYLYNQTSALNTIENECYWYHPDHLGSSSWITAASGEAVQHIHYLPWGEEMVNQRHTVSSAIYTFSAKERDPETGLSYFGSRYYSSDLSIWLSEDPMSDKYPSLSPYSYCADNPVKLVDPNGEAWEVNQEGYIREVGDKDDHTLYAVKGRGETFGDKLVYKFGKEKGQAKSITVNQTVMESLNESKDYSTLNLTGMENEGFKLLRFLSNNTNVEWSYWGGNEWNEEMGFATEFATLATSHKYSRDPGSTKSVMNASIQRNVNHQNPLCFFVHTHPRNVPFATFASPNDRFIKETCLIGSPHAMIGLMVRGVLWDYDNNKMKINEWK